MRLRQALRSGVAAVCIAGVAAPGFSVAEVRGPAPPGLDVHVAQAEGFSRIEFHGAGAGKAVSRRDGQVITFRFARDADPDIAQLRTAPPKWIKTAEKRHVNGRLELAVTLADGADAKVGFADDGAYVNVFPKPAPPPAAAAPAPAPPPVEAEPPRPNPVPAGGVVRLQTEVGAGQVRLSFAWANPAGAAVFRRGDAIWVVFDASAALDVSHAPRGLSQFDSLRAFRGQDYSAIRIEGAGDEPYAVSAQGSTWTIALGPGADSQPDAVRVGRDAVDGPATLKAVVAGATRVIRLPDPVVGDEVTVITALGPPKGLATRRDYVQLALLPCAQGLAIQAFVDDLAVQRSGDLVHIATPRGLTLSPAWAAQDRAQQELGVPQPAAMPALIDAERWPRTPPGGFMARYDALVAAASAEGAQTGPEAPVAARMALARFLVGSELSFEAIGVLNAAAKAHPALLQDAEFRGLRGAARVMARRYREADADFSSPVLTEDPASALWRAYTAAKQYQWTETRAQFAKGVQAYALFPPKWKARFARADAQAAIRLGDLSGAQARINLALQEKVDSLEQLESRLVQARIFELQGDRGRALKMYVAITGAPVDSLAAPALLRATQLKLQNGSISPAQAAQTLDALRFRWRGDATEIETIRALGQLYLAQGRYRDALEAMRSAGLHPPDVPETALLQADLSGAFKALFLNGMADGLEPVQALALFYDFKDLTPIGADGDLMVRKLVRRLVDVDLLPQAEELLKYQADNRLDGVARAQVATDLALIYLMDRKPEQALEAINASRTTVLPTVMTMERRLIEARAWTGLGRYDSALEILGKDNSRDAEELRAEISWKQKNWAVAAPLYEKALGERWKTPGPLSSEDEGRLLRAGVAYSLAGDAKALARLDQQYRGFYDQAHNPAALRVALQGDTDGKVSVADFGRVTADADVFAGWVARMKVRLEAPRSPLEAAAAKTPGKPGGKA